MMNNNKQKNVSRDETNRKGKNEIKLFLFSTLQQDFNLILIRLFLFKK